MVAVLLYECLLCLGRYCCVCCCVYCCESYPQPRLSSPSDSFSLLHIWCVLIKFIEVLFLWRIWCICICRWNRSAHWHIMYPIQACVGSLKRYMRKLCSAHSLTSVIAMNTYRCEYLVAAILSCLYTSILRMYTCTLTPATSRSINDSSSQSTDLSHEKPMSHSINDLSSQSTDQSHIKPMSHSISINDLSNQSTNHSHNEPITERDTSD